MNKIIGIVMLFFIITYGKECIIKFQDCRERVEVGECITLRGGREACSSDSFLDIMTIQCKNYTNGE